MCLTRVIGRKTLSEDTPCWGLVKLTEQGDETVYQKELIVADEVGMIYAKTDQVIHAHCCNLEYGDNKYTIGFHRFLNLEDAESRKGVEQAIRKFIIPSGTRVTIGRETEGYVVVTPTLSLVTTNIKKRENHESIQSVCNEHSTGNKQTAF